jgi:6-phosphogluconate dehydrogenase (decarboxylating)
MGVNIVRRLLRNDRECVVFNRTPEKVKQLISEGVIGAYTLDDSVQKPDKPGAIWLMVPAADPTEDMVMELAQKLEAGGHLHCGSNDAGHFVKMGYNGIEYGIMAAYAEGFNILHHANVGKQQRSANAKSTPLRNPEHYQYNFNLPDVAWTITAAIDEGALGHI